MNKTIMTFLLIIFLLKAQEVIPSREIFANFESEISLDSLHSLNLSLKLTHHQLYKTLTLNFIPLESNQTPNFTIMMSFNDSNFSMVCQDPVSKNRSCFFNINPSEQTDSHVEPLFSIFCYSSKCHFKLKPILEVLWTLKNETASVLYVHKDQCSIIGFDFSKLSSLKRTILSVRVHSFDAHSIFPNTDLESFFRYSTGSPLIYFQGDRIIFMFQGADQDLCSHCKVSFIFCSVQELMLEAIFWNYTELQELKLNSEYIDYLSPTTLFNDYKLSLDPLQGLIDDVNMLFITLTSLSGSSKIMYVHGDFQPRSFKDYQFSTSLADYFEEEDIVITKEDLQLSNLGGQNFFVLIKGQNEGFYKIEAKISDSLIVMLSLGMSESRAIKAGELQYYKLFIWNSASQDGVLLLKLTVETGNIEVFGRICSMEANRECPLITELDIQNNIRIDYKSDSKEGNKVLRFPSNCFLSEPYCYVLFLVRGTNSTLLGLNRYNLLISRENGIVTLLENIRHDSHIELNGRINYKLSITDSSHQIEIIKFRINADLPYFVTRNVSCLKRNCSEITGTSKNPVVISKGEFSGDYYLVVEGSKSTDFSIFPEVVRKDQPVPEIPLTEGKPFKGVLDSNTQAMKFSFVIENEKEEFDIEIILQGAKDKFEIQVFNGNDGSFGWSSTTNLLLVHHTKSDDKTYRITVSAAHSTELTSSSLEFRIFYATDKTLRTLEKNKILYETIKPMTFKYYIFYVDTKEDSCVVSKHVINPINLAVNLEVYLSNVSYPDQDNLLFRADYAETSRIVLGRNDFVSLCSTNSNPQHCPIYLAAYNRNPNNEIIFSLMVHFQSVAVEIIDGHEQRFILNQKEEILRGYFIPNNANSSIDLYFYTENQKFEVFFNIYDDKENLAVTQHYFPYFPNKTSYLFYIHENKEISQVIKPKSLENCWPHCIILFTIVYSTNALSPSQTSLSILISSNNTEIHEGKSITFSLSKMEFKYFYFNLGQFLKDPSFEDSSSLLISLTSFYGNAFMYVNVASLLKTEKPTFNEADYYIYNNHFTLEKGSILTSLKEQISETSKLFGSARLVIGIFSEDGDGKFMINILNSQNAIQSIYTGIPQDVFLKKDSGMYFQYYFGFEICFKIYFNRETGVGTVGMLACSYDSVTSDSEIFRACISKPETDFKIISGTGSSFYEVNYKTSTNFCQNCYFLIHVKSVSGDLKGSLVIKEGEGTLISLQEGKKFFDHIPNKEESRFQFWTSGLEIVEISLTVFQGNPIVYFSNEFTKKREDFSLSFKLKDKSNLIHFFVPPAKASYLKHKGANKREWELPDEWGQYSNHYLLVYCDRAFCEYSLSYVSSASQILQGGVVHLDRLRSMDTKGFAYTKTDDLPTYLTITCDDTFDFTKMFNFSVRFRKFNEAFQKNELVNISLERSFISDHAEGYMLPSNQSGTYFFKLTSLNKNLSDQPAKYSLAINSREISIVPIDKVIRTFLSAKTTRYYETYVSESGFLVLEVLECVGNLEILMTKSYDSVLLEDFEEDFKPVVGQSFIHVMKVQNSEMIYLAMKSLKEISVFDFSLKFYQNYHKIPQVKYSMGNQGIMDYVFSPHEGKFTISFAGVQCEDCEEGETNEILVEYFIFHSEKGIALSAKGKCGVSSFGDGRNIDVEVFSQFVGTHQIGVSLIHADVKIDGKGVNFVTVKAKVMRKSESILEIYYPIIQINETTPTHRWIFWVVNISIIVLLLTCCILSLYFYRKYRLAMKKLKYEMEDVRNVAQGTAINRTSIEMEKKTYQGLIEN